MRKLLVAALAAAMVVGGATAALAASGSGASLKVTLKPNKHGTKKKPKGAKVRLVFNNNNHNLTATKITIQLAKQVAINTKGFKFCSVNKITNSAGSACPKQSKVGTGSSDAIAGVNTTSPTPLTFSVTAYLVNKKSVAFFLQQQGGSITTVALGKFSKAHGKFGTKLTVTIPTIAKEFPTGTFNGLVKLDTTLGGKSGKRNLVGITGCPKSKKLPFSTTVNFQNNPAPPPTPSVSAKANAKCR
ncbi:MAG TPA: hypothetical protein VH418_17510 [Solirubrobacteraceae bacterium]